MKYLQILLMILTISIMCPADAAARPAGRIVVGEPPSDWMPQGPGWFTVPDRDELLWTPASSAEWRIVYDLVEGCVSAGRVTHQMVDPFDVLAVLRLEDHLGVPWEARGILVSVWCLEASMRHADRRGGPIRGDFKNGVARAHGPAQLWPWFRAWCGLGTQGADHLLPALACYWSRVVDRYIIRDTNRCQNPWAVAEALAANGPRYLSVGCSAQSSHWRALMKWRTF